MPNPGITKPTTIQTFMKAHTDLRVGADAVALLLDRLNILAAAVAKAAETNAKMEGRTTIMAPDVTAAMTTVTGSTSDLPFLFKQLETLSAKDTAALSDLIQNWVDSH